MNDLRNLLIEGLSPDQTLSSLYDIENILLLIGEINHKLEYYKELKKHRVQSIDASISELTGKTEALRSIVMNTMKKVAPNDKTLNFPDIGKVSRRKSKDGIVIDDQAAVLDFLDKKGEKGEVVKVVKSVDKRKLNSIVSAYQKSGDQVPGISIVAGTESLSITLEKPSVEDHSSDHSSDQPSGTKIDLEELDALLV